MTIACARAGAQRRRQPAWAIAAIFAAYLAMLICAHGRVPPALNNDVAEEGLRAVYLVQGHHLEVMTFAVGFSAETLYLYLVGGMIQLFGRTVLSIQLVSWLFALACLWLVRHLVACLTDTIPAWIPVLTGASSIWLFHYAMAGLRAISAPVFVGAFALLLDRVERGGTRRIAFLCGAVLGLSIYAYTSARVLPVAFVLYAALRLVRSWRDKAVLFRRYGVIILGTLVVSIPNTVLLIQRPRDFLSRGSYVARGTAADMATNAFWSILFPFHYPDFYRHTLTYTFSFDAVCAGLTLTGVNPIHWVMAVAMLIGLWQGRPYAGQPVMAFLLATWVAAMAVLGWTGPSLTRLLILWPVYMVLAALGVGFLIDRWRWLRIPVLLLILFVGGSDAYRYVSGEGRSPQEYSLSFNTAATAIGERARTLESHGERVLCVISRDASVVKYLAGEAGLLGIVEFYNRPFVPSELPLDNFRPTIVLIEDYPTFRSFTDRIRPELLVAHNAFFREVRMPPRTQTD